MMEVSLLLLALRLFGGMLSTIWSRFHLTFISSSDDTGTLLLANWLRLLPVVLLLRISMDVGSSVSAFKSVNNGNNGRKL
jgi:hypothetical protein